MTDDKKRPLHRVLFDPFGLASSLGEDAQEALADRLGDPTDPIHDRHYQAEEEAFTRRYEARLDRMNATRDMHRVKLPTPSTSATPAPGPIPDAQAEADFIAWRNGGCRTPAISVSRPAGRPNLFVVPKGPKV